MPTALSLIAQVPPVGEVVTVLLLLGVLVAISALMSGSEVALLGFSRVRRLQLEEEEHPRIGAVERLMEHPDRLLITILIGNTIANALAAAVVTSFALSVFDSYAVAIATGVTAFAVLTFGEVIPKAFAARGHEKWALRAAPVLLAMQRGLYPLILVYERLTRALFAKNAAAKRSLFKSEEEIKALITVGTEEGVLEQKEEDMLHSVIEFGETTAKEVMVPRIDMTAVSADSTLDAIRPYVLESGYSRVPVYQGTVDNVVGILYVKDMLLHFLEKKAGSVQVRDLMREAFFVPESKKLDDLLADMREKRVHMAIVIDEFGGTAGMLTLEDVIEEIVGDIFDEYDLRTDPVRQLDPLTAIVDARTHVADVNDALDLEIPEDQGYDTVAGYVYHELGRLGREGEVVHGPGFDVVVEKVTNRRILRVRFVKHTPPEPSAEAADATEEAAP